MKAIKIISIINQGGEYSVTTTYNEVDDSGNVVKKNTKAPTIIEFIIDPEEMVYPMIKPGGTLADMIMDC